LIPALEKARHSAGFFLPGEKFWLERIEEKLLRRYAGEKKPAEWRAKGDAWK